MDGDTDKLDIFDPEEYNFDSEELSEGEICHFAAFRIPVHLKSKHQ